MMATAAVVGLSSGKRLLSSSFTYSELPERLYCMDQLHQSTPASTRNVMTKAKKTSNNFSPNFQSSRHIEPIKAVKELTEREPPLSVELSNPQEEKDFSLEALLLLQKSMLEKQWMLPFGQTGSSELREDTMKKMKVTSSGIPARLRRIMTTRRRTAAQHPSKMRNSTKLIKGAPISPELLQPRLTGYVRGVTSEEYPSHAEVVQLSRKIKTGLSMEERRSRLKERLGCEPTDEQLARSLGMTRIALQSKLIECSLAREKLAMSNVRLVTSIAQRYENMGADMSDLIQGGLIGLLRGIEKFDSSKGFRISTYVYWWIRQGVSRALVQNSRTLRLPTHLHERLTLIRNAKYRLEEKGMTPTVDRIAESLNMSHKKISNATEAIKSVLSLDREAYPSLNGLPGETFHSYIADNSEENNPWNGVDEWALKDEVTRLMDLTLREREKDIIRLYYGLDNECLTWEEISKRIGLSRERVRQVGLVALEKLKHAARKRRLEALLEKH